MNESSFSFYKVKPKPKIKQQKFYKTKVFGKRKATSDEIQNRKWRRLRDSNPQAITRGSFQDY